MVIGVWHEPGGKLENLFASHRKEKSVALVGVLHQQVFGRESIKQVKAF
jgi:hypothetical protein